MALSKKKEKQLYTTVHEEIMQARIKINMKFKHNGGTISFDEIDNILSDLNRDCPAAAIEVFEPKT